MTGIFTHAKHAPQLKRWTHHDYRWRTCGDGSLGTGPTAGLCPLHRAVALRGFRSWPALLVLADGLTGLLRSPSPTVDLNRRLCRELNARLHPVLEQVVAQKVRGYLNDFGVTDNSRALKARQTSPIFWHRPAANTGDGVCSRA